MTSYTVTYEQVSASTRRNGKCPTCEKHLRRQMTFTETVNPFNKNTDGTVKTWFEVNESVRLKAANWNPDPEYFEHEKCRNERLGYA